jgi:hypothetical protein
MALKAIIHTSHSKLAEMQLQFITECDLLVAKLSDCIEKYRKVAAKINERQPLVKRKEPQQH